MKGGHQGHGQHPALQHTSSHPVSSTTARLQTETTESRGSSLGRNVPPPASSGAWPPSSLARPPSHVSEETSDAETDAETTPGVERSSSVKMTPSGAGLLPPPPANPRYVSAEII